MHAMVHIHTLTLKWIPEMQSVLIWLCSLFSTDVAKENYREKPIRTSRCTSYTQYIFQWSSALDHMDSPLLDVESGKLRAYIQIISRHISEGASVDVNVTVFMVPRHNATANITDWSEGVFAGQQVLTVSHGSDGWVELNVTEGAREIWPNLTSYSEVQVIIKAEVNCTGKKKVPFNFINPAEIPLEQENRRARHLDFQPFFVVFANNRETLQTLLSEDEDVGGEESGNVTFRELGDELFPEKRSADSDECSIERYVVNLHELGLTYIIFPTTLNISKCAGNCNNRNTINRLGTNHAKIMMAIYNAEINTVPPLDEVTATPPCCVPTDYRVVYFLVSPLDGTAAAVKSHNHLVATRCGCR